MNESEIKAKIAELEKRGVDRVNVAITDIDGVLAAKYISFEKFKKIALTHGAFCDVVLGWDLNDELYDNTKYTGWHTAYPDAYFKIDFSTERRIPFEENVPFYIADFIDNDSKSLHPVGPRSLFKKIELMAKDMGFGVNLAYEYEFFIFNETIHTIREKNYKNLKPFTPGMFGYSLLRTAANSDIFNEFIDFCNDMDFSLEGIHCETGPGVWEAAITYDRGIKSVDKAILFKTFAKVFFQKRDLVATFMAKWSLKYPGQSGHIHQSFYDLKTGENVFYSKDDPDNMSQIMKYYLAGQIKYLREFFAMCAPNINSYTRIVKGAWAPTSSSWGVENRTTAYRVIQGGKNSQRIEFRIGSADCNPYIIGAANIAAGLRGIQEKCELPEAIKGNAYDQQDNLPLEYQLPGNLLDAARLLDKSRAARDLFGDQFVDHYVATREWEVREYQRSITDWQLERYFEII